MKYVLNGLISISTVAVLTACGGGGGDAGGDSPAIDNDPIAVAGPDQNTFGGRQVTLDASGSSDDKRIVEYIWKEGSSVLGKGITLEQLFSDGEHTVTLTVTDEIGQSATDSLKVTAECMNASPINIVDEVEGTVNASGANLKSDSCYKLNLTSNNNIETYTFYMNLLNGTVGTTQVYVSLFDEDGVKSALGPITNGSFYILGQHLMETFTVSNDGMYYIQVKRHNDAAKYALSVHPSLDNGLQQNADQELNDNITMAAPITLAEAMNDITGNLHMLRDQENSLKNTDDTDYYSIVFPKDGRYTFYMNLLAGTKTGKNVYVTIQAEDDIEVPLGPVTNGSFYRLDDNFRETFDVQASKKYFIKIYRSAEDANYAFSIHPPVDSGLLIQNADRELNDNIAMAAPITLAEANSDINGSLHMSRNQENSLKATDDTDYYSIEITTSDTYTFYMKLLPLTLSGKNVQVTIQESNNGIEVPLSPTGNGSFGTQGKEFTKDVPLPTGKYFIKVYRSSYDAVYTLNIKQKP